MSLVRLVFFKIAVWALEENFSAGSIMCFVSFHSFRCRRTAEASISGGTGVCAMSCQPQLPQL